MAPALKGYQLPLLRRSNKTRLWRSNKTLRRFIKLAYGVLLLTGERSINARVLGSAVAHR